MVFVFIHPVQRACKCFFVFIHQPIETKRFRVDASSPLSLFKFSWLYIQSTEFLNVSVLIHPVHRACKRFRVNMIHPAHWAALRVLIDIVSVLQYHVCFLINSNKIIFALLALLPVTIWICVPYVLEVLVTKGLSFVLGGNLVDIWALLLAVLENALR
jgi:hypothetical protein